MYDIGYIVGSIIFGLLTVLSVELTVYFAVRRVNASRLDRANYTFGTAVSFIAALVFAVIFTIGQFPFDSAYHKYNTYSGTVDQVASRVLPAGDKQVEQKFVVRFKDSDQEYGCLDTRCALVKPGDHLTLSCIKEWEWAGTDGFDCKYGKNVPAAKGN